LKAKASRNRTAKQVAGTTRRPAPGGQAGRLGSESPRDVHASEDGTSTRPSYSHRGMPACSLHLWDSDKPYIPSHAVFNDTSCVTADPGHEGCSSRLYRHQFRTQPPDKLLKQRRENGAEFDPGAPEGDTRVAEFQGTGNQAHCGNGTGATVRVRSGTARCHVQVLCPGVSGMRFNLDPAIPLLSRRPWGPGSCATRYELIAQPDVRPVATRASPRPSP
jgi:hypothetical protein